METTSANTFQRIPSLDGLRAFSILLVLIGHARSTLGSTVSENVLLWRMIGNQQLGVSLFFVISGFLITSILSNEIKKNGKINLKRFYLRRVFRILPAFYFLLICLFLFSILGNIDLSHHDLISAATFTWNYLPSTKDWWVGHSWSLSVEEQFYLFWPALMLFSSMPRSKKWTVFFILLAPLIRVAWYFLFPEWRGRLSIMLHTRVDTLMFGCFLALFWDNSSVQKIITNKFLFYSSLFFLLLLSPLLSHRFAGSYMMTIGYTLEGIAMTIALGWLVSYPFSYVGKILNSPIAVKIGVLSYGLYLWQQPFLTSKNTTFTGMFPLNLIIVFILAELSYRYIEKPFLKLKPA